MTPAAPQGPAALPAEFYTPPPAPDAEPGPGVWPRKDTPPPITVPPGSRPAEDWMDSPLGDFTAIVLVLLSLILPAIVAWFLGPLISLLYGLVALYLFCGLLAGVIGVVLYVIFSLRRRGRATSPPVSR